jgi:peptide deformylase
MKIKLFNSPILRQQSVEVIPQEFGSEQLNNLVKEMTETMYKEEGIGLAANQVGDNRAVCVMDSSEPDAKGLRNQPRVFINPKIVASTSEFVVVEESCLSIPGVFANTERFKGVTVRYKTIDGHEVEEVLDGVAAIAMQHEVDHLNGKLYVDMLGPVKKNLIISKCQKYIKARARGAI